MVTAASAIKLPKDELRWRSVSLTDVLAHGLRLDGGFYNTGGWHARQKLNRCKWPIGYITGENGIASSFYPPRFKRIMVKKSEYPLILPSQIEEVNPKPKGYLSRLCDTNFDTLKAKKGQILMTRSGTVGNCRLVSDIISGQTISDDIIRIICKKEQDTGYLYAYLRTETGKALVQSSEYGAVISHIEPDHLESVPIPNPPAALKKRIHELVIRSYALRDRANSLLDTAEQLFCEALNLPPLAKLRPAYFDKSTDLRNWTVNFSDYAGRLDASYHVPIANSILRRMKKEAAEMTTVGDDRISRRIILPGRFPRVYVQEGQGGVPSFGGKQIHEIDPINKKYLSRKHHRERIERELALNENMVMITRSGTIGKVTIVPKHWAGWTANEHIIRVVPATPEVAGYLYVFLQSDYGHELITRFTYGSVVDEIDDTHVAKIPVPLLKDAKKQNKISRLALEANAKRTEAYEVEQEAIRITNEEVIYAMR
ncbi:MAG: restriction endonuclease subunit S [Gammaproteobacteria bacterium]|nr:restriction endonuclease subunit S [Gammaproteobacteria bacterium]